MFLFSGCCQCEVAKQNNEQIDVSAVFDEGIDVQDVAKYSQRSTAQNVDGKEAAQEGPSGEKCPSTPSTRSPSGNQSTRSEVSMDEEERLAEKARLQALVTSFSREAVLGMNCKMLQKSERTRASHEYHHYVTAKFFLDKALKGMVIHAGGKETLIPLVDVVEICTHEDLKEQVPDSQLGKDLREEDRSSAIFIEHQAPGFSMSWLCVVVADEASQERFVDCMKILRLYVCANATKQSPSQR
jgi:hypothetical protein